MKQKKIIALVSLLVLIGGVVALAMWIKNRPTEKQKAFQEKFSRDMQEGAKNKTTSGVAVPRKTLNPSKF